MPRKINSNSNSIVALDIGTSKVTVIVANIFQDGGLEIVGVGSQPTMGMRKGMVTNVDAISHSIQRAIEEAELSSGCQVHSVYTGISGAHVHSFNSNGIVAIKDKIVSQQDIDRVIDAAKAVAIPNDQKIIHVLPQEYTIDDETNIKKPLGMAGVRLEANVHMVTGSVSCAQNIVNSIRRCNVDVEDIILAPLASSYAVLTEDEKDMGVCMLDLGAGTTDIAVFTDGAIRYTASIPVAGSQVTNDLAVALRTTIDAAENVKISHACALKELADEELMLDIANLGDGRHKRISQVELANIVELRYEELFILIREELHSVGLSKVLNSGIVLTGGSARLKGVIELAESVFNLPVRLGAPCNVAELKDEIKLPKLSTSLGLLLYGLAKQDRLKANYGVGRKLNVVVDRVKNWFQGNF